MAGNEFPHNISHLREFTCSQVTHQVPQQFHLLIEVPKHYLDVFSVICLMGNSQELRL